MPQPNVMDLIGTQTNILDKVRDISSAAIEAEDLPKISSKEAKKNYDACFLRARQICRKQPIMIDENIVAILSRITSMVFPGARISLLVSNILEQHLEEYKTFLEKQFKDNIPKSLY